MLVSEVESIYKDDVQSELGWGGVGTRRPKVDKEGGGAEPPKYT